MKISMIYYDKPKSDDGYVGREISFDADFPQNKNYVFVTMQGSGTQLSGYVLKDDLVKLALLKS